MLLQERHCRYSNISRKWREYNKQNIYPLTVRCFFPLSFAPTPLEELQKQTAILLFDLFI